ncbi:hypothetical protein HWV62_1176, partial [Athelia sp. TMB]
MLQSTAHHAQTLGLEITPRGETHPRCETFECAPSAPPFVSVPQSVHSRGNAQLLSRSIRRTGCQSEDGVWGQHTLHGRTRSSLTHCAAPRRAALEGEAHVHTHALPSISQLASDPSKSARGGFASFTATALTSRSITHPRLQTSSEEYSRRKRCAASRWLLDPREWALHALRSADVRPVRGDAKLLELRPRGRQRMESGGQRTLHSRTRYAASRRAAREDEAHAHTHAPPSISLLARGSFRVGKGQAPRLSRPQLSPRALSHLLGRSPCLGST